MHIIFLPLSCYLLTYFITLGLGELLTFNSIPNIDEGKNKFYVGGQVITIPTGSYEVKDIENHLQKILSTRGISISLQPNNNSLYSEIKCNRPINFDPDDSIGHLLGFRPRILAANVTHTSFFFFFFFYF